jgi:uncharacterized protein
MGPTTTLQEPLRKEELDELQAFLDSDATSDDGMDLSALHGLLTAVVSGPETCMPSEWLPVALGSREPSFTSDKHAQRIPGLIMRLHNEISSVLMEAPQFFDPILLTAIGGKSERSYAFAWCRGFVAGANVRENAWKRYFDDPTVLEGLDVFARLVDDVPGERLPRGMRRAEVPGEIARAARSLHAFFLDLRRRERIVQRSSPRVGRNAPCPCGSGKKYKLCCGAA